VGTFERCARARADRIPSVVEAFDQALGGTMKALVSWTLRTPPAHPASDYAPYNIEKFRNPNKAIEDSVGCPRGNDASNVPVVDAT
jgi:cholesterol transport system auxiliary component